MSAIMQMQEHEPTEAIKKAITLAQKLRGRGKRSEKDVFKFLQYFSQSGLDDEKFTLVTNIEPAKFYFWKNGKFSSGDDWIELQNMMDKNAAEKKGKELADEFNREFQLPLTSKNDIHPTLIEPPQPVQHSDDSMHVQQEIEQKIELMIPKQTPSPENSDPVEQKNQSNEPKLKKSKKPKNKSFILEGYPDYLITINPSIYDIDPTKFLVYVRMRRVATPRAAVSKKIIKQFRKLTPSGMSKDNIKDWIIPQIKKKLGTPKIKKPKIDPPFIIGDTYKIMGVQNGNIIIEKKERRVFEIDKNHPEYNKYVDSIFAASGK